MVALTLAAVAVIIYFTSVGAGTTTSIRVFAIAAGVSGAASLVGLTFAWFNRVPKLSSFLLGGWTVAMILIGASIAAILVQLTTSLKPFDRDTAPTDVRTLVALLTAALAALIEQSATVIKSRTGPWLAREVLCHRYNQLFPAMPSAPKEGVEAYRQVSLACQDESLSSWALRKRIALFSAVGAAIRSGGYKGGAHWKDIPPPEPSHP